MHINHTAKRLKNFWLLYDGREDQKKSRADTLQADDVNFIMCSIFGLVAVVVLFVFSIAALTRQDINYAFTLFSFALTTIIGLGGIWISGADWLAKHFTTLLMAILCVYFFLHGRDQRYWPSYFIDLPLSCSISSGQYCRALFGVEPVTVGSWNLLI